MSRTKAQQIADLKGQLAEMKEELIQAQRYSRMFERQVDDMYERNNELSAEIESLVHTAQFAADTKSAFDRGRQDGVRSLTYRSNKDMLNLANDIVAAMNELVNKYTRDLTSDIFLGTVEEPVEETIKELPDTEFTKNLLEKVEKSGTLEFIE